MKAPLSLDKNNENNKLIMHFLKLNCFTSKGFLTTISQVQLLSLIESMALDYCDEVIHIDSGNIEIHMLDCSLS